MWLGFSKKWWSIVGASFVALILITYGTLVLINGTSNEPATPPASSSNSSTNTNSQTGSSGSSVALYGSVVSLRNLKGLLAQINQIDVCSAPDLTAYITVTAKDASALNTLTKKDFTVSIDGKQTQDFALELVSKKDLPISNTLVLDHSGSMTGVPMQKAKEAAIGYINRTNAKDKVAIIQFDTQIDTLQALTTNHKAAIKAINGIATRSDTALYDAVVYGAEKSPECGRKALVILTDGEDTASKNKLDSAINKANKANVPVFVVGLRSSGFSPSVLKSIAEKTGAQYFEAAKPSALNSMYKKISNQLGNQYYLSFKLNIPKTGGTHKLKISSTIEGSPTTSERSFVY